MSESVFAVGQRWISHSEAELGLGIIKEDLGRRVVIIFPAADEERTYASDNAPLSRVAYGVDEQVETASGQQFVITARHELNGGYFYHGTDTEGNEVSIHELDLSSHVQFSQPQDRLFAGQIDKNRLFELRVAALFHQHRLSKSKSFGLMGPRVQLLPHQLYIAYQVGQRFAPRVLLADEVGLGKTIEAGLIIHQQLLTGRAARVLIVVPDSLLHQWLVELLRRFNLAFTVMDEERYEAIIEADEGNPFDSAQLILCPLSELVASEQMQQSAHDADWDLMVVDEAHHLHWSEMDISDEYACISQLAAQVPGLLLLTATPEQWGVESHFARLKLLDPDRYYDLAVFQQQETEYTAVNNALTELLATVGAEDIVKVSSALSQYLTASQIKSLSDSDNDFEGEKQKAVRYLLDLHGTGRILFRNTREAVSGFPKRLFQPHPLAAPDEYNQTCHEASDIELMQAEQLLGPDWLGVDTRVHWLVEWLSTHRDEKVLVICAQAQTAQDLEQALRMQYGKRSTVFHEGLSLVNRDRAAAYFADDEYGAQVMICSEIGSEGRNFQFSHHLVLFDLPLNPDLLEQRIGRLDRIGQQYDVMVHCPYYENTAQDKLVHWYHEGLNAFEQVCAIGRPIFDEVSTQLLECLHDDDIAISELVDQTKQLAEARLAELETGRNRLLELNSCDPTAAEELIAELETASQPSVLSAFMDNVFDAYGVEQQEHSADSVILSPGTAMLDSHFPGLDEEGLTATYHRHRALHREDMAFLSWEHPMVTGSIDMICNSDIGNTAFCTLDYPELAEGTLLLEAIFKVSVSASKALQINRYLSAGYIRVVVDDKGRDFNAAITEAEFNAAVGKIPTVTKQALVKQAKPMIEQLVEQANVVATRQREALISSALSTMQTEVHYEQQRLSQLAEVNTAIRPDELSHLDKVETTLSEVLSSAQLGLDAVRVAIVAE